jgi:hypothetical protein
MVAFEVREGKPNSKKATVEIGMALQALHDTLHPLAECRRVVLALLEAAEQLLGG